jgi:RNA polymerase sigma-70 factor (ECF subfamily)
MEEVQQEVLIALAAKQSVFGGKARFSTYLFSVVHHKAIDYLRRRARDERRRAALMAAGEGERTTASPLDEFVDQDEAGRLLGLMLKLPVRDRSLLFLREVEGVGEKECARTLGMAVGTVKSRVHRLKKQLYLKMTTEREVKP